MLRWCAWRIITYTFIPACTHVGTTIGSYVGMNVIHRVWNTATNSLRGVVNVTLKRNRTYVVCKGEVLEIDPRKKYIIVGGEVKVVDSKTTESGENINNDWEIIK